MLLIAVSLFALGAWYFAVGRLETGSLSTRLVLVGCGTCGQITLTCTWLSVCGAATTGALVLTSVGLSAVGLALIFSLAPRVGTFRERLTGDLVALRRGATALGWETALLGLLLLVAGAWILGASWLYPPRGVDDLVYHLPPIYQTAQNHRFEILPLELRPHFAFPFTAEMPFLWVILLGGSLRWVDGCQLPLVGLAILVVYSLARRCGASVRGAALAGGMFGAMPVVLLQSASNYVDFQACLWVLVAAVAAFRFGESGSRLALVVAGISCGLALGAKYITMLFLLPFAWIVVRRLLAEGRGFGSRVATAGLFLLPVAAVSGYWYARNWLLWKNPLYPYPVSAFGVNLFPGIFMPQGESTWSKIFSDPAELLRIGLWDPGLGTFDGGFGFLFWGFAVPALFYLTWTTLGEPPPRRLELAECHRARPSRTPRIVHQPAQGPRFYASIRAVDGSSGLRCHGPAFGPDRRPWAGSGKRAPFTRRRCGGPVAADHGGHGPTISEPGRCC